ncbi:hypothetical protein GCM10010344_75060 [Streptomyces bluensis]|nr:hypothetical protein GCM10010344_75060 [Streptomyces bluensis]
MPADVRGLGEIDDGERGGAALGDQADGGVHEGGTVAAHLAGVSILHVREVRQMSKDGQLLNQSIY